jgi:hypothetical protein
VDGHAARDTRVGLGITLDAYADWRARHGRLVARESPTNPAGIKPGPTDRVSPESRAGVQRGAIPQADWGSTSGARCKTLMPVQARYGSSRRTRRLPVSVVRASRGG